MATNQRATDSSGPRLTAAAIALAALLPAAGYALAARWFEALAAVVVGAAWLAGSRGRMVWVANLAFLSLVALAAWAVLGGLAPAWGLAGLLAALAAWDVSAFGARLGGEARVVGERALWSGHLRRLGAALAAGLALGAAALLLRVEIGFGWALALGIVAVVALSRAIRPSS